MVSLAYTLTIQKYLQKFGKSSVKIENIKDPNMNPCGTPDLITKETGRVFLYQTNNIEILRGSITFLSRSNNK